MIQKGLTINNRWTLKVTYSYIKQIADGQRGAEL